MVQVIKISDVDGETFYVGESQIALVRVCADQELDALSGGRGRLRVHIYRGDDTLVLNILIDDDEFVALNAALMGDDAS